jgi:nucleoid-associated protein YgaU
VKASEEDDGMATSNTPARVAVLLTTVVVAPILLLANTVGAAGVGDGSDRDQAPVATHRVVTGDTLWDIAADHTGDGDDVRKTVFVIREHNGLGGSVIVPGQVLEIPLSG